MLKRALLLAWSIPLLTLCARELPVHPAAKDPPAVDTTTPVPLPGNPFDTRELLQPTLPKELKIDNQGLVDGSVESGVRLGGPVKIEGDNGMEIFSDTAVLDLRNKSVTLEGKVSVYQGNILQRGERAVYYYEKKFLDSRELSVSMDPFILESGKFTVEQRGTTQVFTGTDAGITTHDVENPNFWVRASQTRIFPGDKIVFKNLLLYAGDVPVFWLPYLSQPLDSGLGYQGVPGARSNWGPYLLNSYGIMLGGTTDPLTGKDENAWLLSKWHLDLRASRGVGTGVDFSDINNGKKNRNLSGLGLYYLYDLNPQTHSSGEPRGNIDPNRYRIELKHRQPLDLPDKATWYLDANLTLLSDNYYLEDFEPEHFRSDPQPDSTLGIFRRNDTTLLSFYARMRINDFQLASSRLPELAFDQARRSVFGLPLLHEGTTSLAVLDLQTVDTTRNNVIDPLLAMPLGDSRETALLSQLSGYERQQVQRIRNLAPGDSRITTYRDQLLNTGYTRFFTYHDFSLPLMLDDGLSLTPQAGIGYTRYMAVDGPANPTDRTHYYAGVEAAVKFTSTLATANNHRWGLDGLLHVIQPYANWSLLGTNELDPTYPQVDRLTQSTRPQTLAPERFTAIDDLRNWNIVRLGLRNRLLTKRDGQSHEWLFLNTYMDAFLNDPELDRRYSNLYNDLRFEPVPWMSVGVETQFPVLNKGSGFNEYSTYMRFLPTPDLELSLGYRWLDKHPVLLNSNHIDLRAYYRINEKWGIGMQQAVELDDGTFEVQQYSLHRDLGNWVAGVGVTRRDNRLNQQYGIIFSLTLKDFPEATLPFRIDTN